MSDDAPVYTTPHTADTPETWGLEKHDVNAARLADFMSAGPKLIWRRRDFKLLMCGYADDGSYALVDEGSAQKIDLYLRFAPRQLPEIGRRVAEVRVWRSNLMAYYGAVTRELLFEHLLPTCGTIASSRELTMSGVHFWSKQMAAAADMGMIVSWIDEHGMVSVCEDPKKFCGWYRKQQVEQPKTRLVIASQTR